jgi:FkbM family methyltransferase
MEFSMIKRSPDKIQTLSLLRDRGVPVGTILDVGVCHGTPELMDIWPDTKHVLFEPVQEFEKTISAAYRNINHELHLVAVGDSPGSVGLRVASVLPGMEISHSSMTNNMESSDDNIRIISKVSLDSFLSNKSYESPYLLKIDIDGQELKVISGASQTLKNCSVVIVECQSLQLVQRISAIQAAGFVLFDLCEPCYYDKMFWQCDAVFIKSEIAQQKFKQLEGKVEKGMYESFRMG